MFSEWSLSLVLSHQKLYARLLFLVRATCSAYLILYLITRITHDEKV